MTAPPKVVLRAAAPEDCERVLAWANEPGARAASFSVAPIRLDDHRSWYARSLAGERRLYVLEVAGRAAGLLRLDLIEPATAEVGIVVDPAFRGRGLGQPALAALREHAREAGLQTLVARIRQDNTVSRRLFAAAGYTAASATSVRGIPAIELRLEIDHRERSSHG